MSESQSSTSEQLEQLLRLLTISAGHSSFAVAQCDDPTTRDVLISEVREKHAGIVVFALPAATIDVYGFVSQQPTAKMAKGIFLTGLESCLLGANGSTVWKSLNASRDLWEKPFPCPVVFWLPENVHSLFAVKAPDFSRFISSRFEFADERFSIFISYSHKDEKWRAEIEKHLQPYLQGGRIEAWSDKSIEPGQNWQVEIQHALQRARIGLLIVSPDFLASSFIVNQELPYLLRAAAESDVHLLWVLINDCAWLETPLRNIQAAHDVKKPLTKLRGHNRATVLTSIAAMISKNAAEAPELRRRSSRGDSSESVEHPSQAVSTPPKSHVPRSMSHRERMDFEGRNDDRQTNLDGGRDGDDFLARVEIVCQLRNPSATIERKREAETRLSYLDVQINEGAITTFRPVIAVQHGVDDKTLQEFKRLLESQYRDADPWVFGELVYGADFVSEDFVRAAWKTYHVKIISWVEYQGLTDFRSYVDRQTQKLVFDPLYPPSLYVPQHADLQISTSSDRKNVDNVLDAALDLIDTPHPRFVLVLGDFGTGKTFLLHEIARRLAESPGLRLTPILVEMRDLQKGRTLDELIAQHLARNGVEQIDLSAFRYMLETGRIVLLFDGFDELALRVTYENATHHFDTLLQAAKGEAKVIVTSRTTYFENEQQIRTVLFQNAAATRGLRVIRIRPFDEEQVSSYLFNQYRHKLDALGNDKTLQRHAEQSGDYIWNALKRLLTPEFARLSSVEQDQHLEPLASELRDVRLALIRNVQDLKGLASNPRMLSFIVDVPHDDLMRVEKELGRITSAELYRLLIDRWLQYEHDRISKPGQPQPLTVDELRRAVMAVALRLWTKIDRTVSAAELEDDVTDIVQSMQANQPSVQEAAHIVGTGALMIWDQDGRLAFVHQSILEWLVALHCAEEIKAGRTPQALRQNDLSMLAAEFVCDLATLPIAHSWAQQILQNTSRTTNLPIRDNLKANASTIADRARVLAQSAGTTLAASHRIEQLDLSGQNLSGRDLSSLDLRRANLSHANLNRVSLAGKDLTEANFAGASLVGADLRRANLTRTMLTDADLTMANLLGTTLDWTAAMPRSLRRARLIDDSTIPAAAITTRSAAINAVAWNCLGDLQATGHDDGTVRLWDVTSGKELRAFTGHIRSVSSVLFSPDGFWIASGSDDGTVRVWDIACGRELRAFTGHSSPASYVLSISFSPDGLQIASGSHDGTVRVWEVASGEELRAFTGHTRSVLSVSFSPDGLQIASGSHDNSLRLWDIERGEKLRSITGHTDTVRSVSFSPDGLKIATGSDDSTVCVWDVASGEQLRSFKGHTDTVRSVSFSPNGLQIISGSDDRNLRLWDVATGEHLRSFTGHTDTVRSVSFSPNGLQIVSGSDDRSLRLWDVATGAELRAVTGYSRSVRSVSISPTGHQLASGGDDNNIRLWGATTGMSLMTFMWHAGCVRRVTFSPDDRQLASASDDHTIILWDLADGAMIKRFTGHKNWVTDVVFNPCMRQLASSSTDHTVKIWDIASGAVLHTIADHKSWVMCVAYSSDGRQMASGSCDFTINLWSPDNGASKSLVGHTATVRSVTFSPDAKYIVSGSDDCTVKVWNTFDGTNSATLHGHSHYVLSVAFCRNGQYLASGSEDRSVIIWEGSSLQQVRKLVGHTSSVTSISFSPNGRHLASGSNDGTIKLWDVETGECLATLLSTPEGWVAFRPDGSYKYDGDIGGSFWHLLNLSRCEVGELDEFIPGLRIPINDPLF